MSTRKRAAAKAWTEAHRQEAFIRCFELCVRHAMNTPIDSLESSADFCSAQHVLAGGYANISTERGWRAWLRAACSEMKRDRIDREVRRVRALAEGRLVRETAWSVAVDNDPRRVTWPTLEKARKWRDDHAPEGARIVKVKRTRRAQ